MKIKLKLDRHGYFCTHDFKFCLCKPELNKYFDVEDATNLELVISDKVYNPDKDYYMRWERMSGYVDICLSNGDFRREKMLIRNTFALEQLGILPNKPFAVRVYICD